jgi:hypothetical protein
MAIFGGTSRDALFLKHVSKEIINRIISVEIALYKLNLQHTEISMYGESSKKFYDNPIRLFTLISKEEATLNDVDTGLDAAQNVVFSFLRDDLKDYDIILDVGDIIKFNANFYEIDNVVQNQFWFGRNPDTLPITTEGRSNYQFGYNQTVKCSTHLTRISQLNLVPVRSGITKTLNIPRNL